MATRRYYATRNGGRYGRKSLWDLLGLLDLLDLLDLLRSLRRRPVRVCTLSFLWPGRGRRCWC